MTVAIGTLGHDCLIVTGKTKEGLPRTSRFWADRGLIHYEDSLDNSYDTMSVRTFLRHVKGLCDMLGNSSNDRSQGADADLRKYIMDIVEKAAEIARKAQEQGMPDDPSACRDLARRQATTVHMSSGNAIM